MECLKCGASILADNAVFCHECGARLDGKITCPKCGQLIDDKYAYCVFCGTRIDQNANNAPCDKTFTKQDEQSFANDNGTVGNKVLAWTRAWVGMALVLFALVFVFLIGFQVDLTGQAVALSQINFQASQENIKLFYYFNDAYKEIETLKEILDFQSNLTITGAYIHAVMGTVISAVTIACVIGFAATAIVYFIMFFIKKVENNSAKWAVRSVVAYFAGCIALKVLNYCFVDINLVFPGSPSWGKPLNATITIDFDIATKIGLILCIVGVALYAIFNCIKQGRSGITKTKLFKFGFGVLAATLAIVVCAVGQNAIVGTAINMSDGFEQNMTLSIKMAQLSFVSFLDSSLKIQSTPILDPFSKIDISYTFAVIQEIMMLGIVVCSLCAIATRIFETEGKTKGTLPFAILTVAFSVAQLITGIVSQSVVHDLYRELFASSAVPINTTLILGNSIITLIFAVLLLATSIIHLTTKKRMKSCSSPQNECLNND